MKNFLKNTAFLFLLITVGFISCSKDDVLSSETSLEPRGSFGAATWNDVCPGDDLTITVTGTGQKQIQQKLNGEWVQIANGSNNSNPISATLNDIEEGTYYFRYKLGGGQSPWNEFSITVEPCCVPGFSYEVNGDGSYTFTLIPEESISNANIVFTFAQADNLEDYSNGWSVNGQTLQKTMNLTECETYVWTFELTCKPKNPNSQGEQNLWTDFKINDVSLKGDLENIKCP